MEMSLLNISLVESRGYATDARGAWPCSSIVAWYGGVYDLNYMSAGNLGGYKGSTKLIKVHPNYVQKALRAYKRDNSAVHGGPNDRDIKIHDVKNYEERRRICTSSRDMGSEPQRKTGVRSRYTSNAKYQQLLSLPRSRQSN